MILIRTGSCKQIGQPIAGDVAERDAAATDRRGAKQDDCPCQSGFWFAERSKDKDRAGTYDILWSG